MKASKSWRSIAGVGNPDLHTLHWEPGRAGRKGWILGLVFLLACVRVDALMLPLATTTLVDKAACIIEGRVVKMDSRWSDDGAVIITEATIEVLDHLLGNSQRVVFTYEGGIVGDLEMQVSDMPTLVQGEHILVFLRPRYPGEAGMDETKTGTEPSYALVGAAQGIYRIQDTWATKSGFTVLDDSEVLDRRVEVKRLKDMIRERLSATQRLGGGK